MNKKLYLILQWTLIFFIACNPPVASEDEEVDPISDVIFSYLQEDEQVFVSANIKDPFNGDSLVSVTLDWYGTGGFEQTGDIVLLVDDGSFGDILSSDGVYSRKVSSTGSDGYLLNQPLTYEDSGKVYLTIRAQYEVQGEVSVSDSFHLGNIKPYILSITIPDTMLWPSQPGFYSVDTIIVEANDPNGLEDLNSCYLMFQKPDSSYANSGNPILLYDDGIIDETLFLWDYEAGDGKFSRLITIGFDNPLGTYHAYFTVSDQAGLKSDMVIRILEVIE